MIRRQLTLFVDEPWRSRLQQLRIVLDPVQAALIPAHVTLCRDDEVASQEEAAMIDRVASWPHGPLVLTFGGARAWRAAHARASEKSASGRQHGRRAGSIANGALADVRERGAHRAARDGAVDGTGDRDPWRLAAPTPSRATTPLSHSRRDSVILTPSGRHAAGPRTSHATPRRCLRWSYALCCPLDVRCVALPLSRCDVVSRNGNPPSSSPGVSP